MTEVIHDPANYRNLAVPFENADAANAAIKAFMNEVRALRQKHGIPDVLTVISMNVHYESGEGRAMTCAHYGDSLNAVPMAAYAYGQLAAEHRASVNQLLAGTR